MPDPDILWQDMAKLNSLYEELCWDADDDLVFTIEGDRIIIRNDSTKKHDMIFQLLNQLLYQFHQAQETLW